MLTILEIFVCRCTEYPRTTKWITATPDDVRQDCGCFFEMLFPPITKGPMEICKTVQLLDVIYQNSIKPGKNGALFSNDAGLVIKSIFPNVRNNAWVKIKRIRNVPERPEPSKKKKTKSTN